MPERDLRDINDTNRNPDQLQEELRKKNKKIDDLNDDINQLHKELNKRNNELVINSQRVASLEDEIIDLRELYPDTSSPDTASKKKGKKIKEKLNLELKVKDNELRQLKDRMGFLRKD